MMMKADVLTGIDNIKACTHYLYNGKKIDYLPFEINEKLTPIYKDLKGWECDLTRLSNINDAPKELHDYINWLEKTLEVPIKIVSVGPDRTQTLSR